MSVIRRMVITLMLLAAVTTAQAATTQQTETARAKGLAWLISHQQSNGSWKTAGGLEVQATSQALNALMNAGIKSGHIFGKGHAWLANAEALSTESLAMQIQALNKTGSKTDELTNRLVSMRNTSSKTWGAYKGYYGSFPDTSLAVRVVYSDINDAINLVLNNQNSDGGWPYAPNVMLVGASGVAVGLPPQSRLIPTSNNVITLCNIDIRNSWQVGTNITNGVNWLVGRQKADGSFSADPSDVAGSAYETALVYLALSEAKNAGFATASVQTVLDNAMNYLITNQQPDGSWGADIMQTSVALQALPSAMLADTDKDGTPDVVEAILNTNANIADAKGFVKDNGVGVTGAIPTVVLPASQNSYFSSFLGYASRSYPSVWSIVSGSLPDGLTLSANTGLISGTPGTVGSYSFTYRVTDANGSSPTANIRIEVAAESGTQAQFTITPKQSLCGTISPVSTITVAKGSDITFMVSPNWNASLADVIIDGVSSVGTLSMYSFNDIAKNHTLEARFLGPRSGDLNYDGKVDIADALIALNITTNSLTPTQAQLAQGDITPLVNGAPLPSMKGYLNSDDAVAILRKTLGLNAWNTDCGKALNIAKSGSGAGSVTSVPNSISCGSSCSAAFATGSEVTLTATPDANSSFAGWVGACSGIGLCTVTQDGDMSVTAIFNDQTPTISVTPSSDSFDNVYLNKASSSHIVTVNNTGTAGLVLGTTTLTGVNPTEFVITANGCAGQTILPSASCTVQISFVPTTTGAKTANISISSNDPTTPTVILPLNGIGVLPVLSVTNNGAGSGTVTSLPGTISCGSTCSSTFTTGALITLTATPDANSSFAGWSGACSGMETCQISLNENKAVAATFSVSPCTTLPVKMGSAYYPTLQAAYNVATDGAIIQSLAVDFAENLVMARAVSVTLDGGYLCGFGAYSQDMTNIYGAPHVYSFSGGTKMRNIRIRTGTLSKLTVAKNGSGTGTVTSTPSGISCGSNCSYSFVTGNPVTLTATADANSTFASWSGGCTGTGDCTVPMNAATSVTATFNTLLPVTSFSATPLNGTAPLVVNFTDTSQSATSWLWDFGDGTTASVKNTSHTYNTPGSYTVRLTAANAFGSTSATKVITVYGAGYRYWRLRSEWPGNSGAGIALSEIKLEYDGSSHSISGNTLINMGAAVLSQDGTMQDNLTTGYTYINDAFDWKIDLGAGVYKKVTKFLLAPYSGGYHLPTNLTFYYSNDAINWLQCPAVYTGISGTFIPNVYGSFPTGL